MSQAILVLTTAADEQTARQLAEALLEARLAACINILPRMTSLYRWKGQMEEGTEHQLFIKTRAECYPAVEQKLRALHPYELPELIVTPITGGLSAYLNWIDESTQQ